MRDLESLIRMNDAAAEKELREVRAFTLKVQAELLKKINKRILLEEAFTYEGVTAILDSEFERVIRAS